jgi:hypothetical protein
VANVSLTLTCYRGHYGSSSCSTGLSVGGDPDIFRAALVAVLNRRIGTTLEEVADYLDDQARKLVSQEIQAAEKRLGDLREFASTSPAAEALSDAPVAGATEEQEATA